MKRQIFVVLILSVQFIYVKSQQWDATIDPVWTNSRMGIGNNDPESKLSVNGFVGASTNYCGIEFKGSGSSPVNGCGWFGIKSEVELRSYADDKLYGVFSLVSKTNNSGGEGYMYGFYSSHKVSLGKKVTYGFGYYAKPEIEGTLENYYGVKLDANIGTGTINNKWGIYQTASDYGNYFAGKVGIGTDSPEKMLHVVGYYNLVQLRLERSGSSEGFCDLGGSDGDFRVWAGGYDSQHKFIIKADNGNVGIGTTSPTNKLEVNGTIRSKEVKVEASPWPDYVFTEEHSLPDLQEVNTYIQQNGHLPEIPTAKEVEENGISLGEMNAKLLQKIEELTLYTIGQQKTIDKLLKNNEKLTERVEMLENKK